MPRPARVIHVSGRRDRPWLTDADHEQAMREPCCYGAALDGAARCTCWTPVYDREQATSLRTDVAPETRTVMCGDCAYRDGSPERERGDELPDTPGRPFWCHRGARRVIAYQHTDGRRRSVPDGVAYHHYDPPITGGVPYRADGLPEARCAGWAAACQADA